MTIEWIEIVVPVGAADVDDVAALIASEVKAAAAGTELRGDEVVFWVDAGDVATALAETHDAVARWAAGGIAVDATRVHTAAAVPEAEWRDAWKRYFKVSRLTRQFVVVPSWEQYTALPGDVVIDLDPGMAFGTGTHASTQLVLEELQQLADDGATPDRILDLGCGSGILAIAAVKRWTAARCVAIDIDPIAVKATIDNATHNGVADRIVARTELVARERAASIAARADSRADTANIDGPEPFPLVLANIQAHVLRELKAMIVARTGRVLVLSGLLTPQALPLAEEYVATGLRLVRIRASAADPQWSCVVLTR